jgi:hypothetical protein
VVKPSKLRLHHAMGAVSGDVEVFCYACAVQAMASSMEMEYQAIAAARDSMQSDD